MFYDNSIFAIHGENVILNLKVTPKAAQNKIGQAFVDSNGSFILKAYVTAVPEQGKANQAVIALLAKTFNIKKSQMSIKSGLTSKNKVIIIKPNLGQSLEDLLTQLSLVQIKMMPS